ncbi:hypothetical protein E2C01_056778 [Portunus trituberculatus]|uniref:Uncharacterized protein n=1 Tax=Portunus trituberculatus TaxID=210409 RepID=A0A5B7GRR3_PORTR|nr:hypothetical protein [Portunus trituberculatus]
MMTEGREKGCKAGRQRTLYALFSSTASSSVPFIVVIGMGEQPRLRYPGFEPWHANTHTSSTSEQRVMAMTVT